MTRPSDVIAVVITPSFIFLTTLKKLYTSYGTSTCFHRATTTTTISIITTFFMTTAAMMRGRSLTLRHLLASKSIRPTFLRAYHASSIVSGDALDMVDTFDRRHCK